MSLSKVIRFLPGGNRDAAKMGGKLVLLVEENQEVSNLLAHNLRRDGYAVDVALTAADALKYLDAQRYALAIVDWRLPDGNGIDVADRAAKAEAKTLIISGYLFGLPGGAADRHDMLMKPIRPSEFVAAVRRAIGGSN
jgi:two-component system OmpR family response regulator